MHASLLRVLEGDFPPLVVPSDAARGWVYGVPEWGLLEAGVVSLKAVVDTLQYIRRIQAIRADNDSEVAFSAVQVLYQFKERR